MAKNKKEAKPTDDIVMDSMPGGDVKTKEEIEPFQVDLNFEDAPAEEPAEEVVAEVEEEVEEEVVAEAEEVIEEPVAETEEVVAEEDTVEYPAEEVVEEVVEEVEEEVEEDDDILEDKRSRYITFIVRSYYVDSVFAIYIG